jgi:hypothetical protein
MIDMGKSWSHSDWIPKSDNDKCLDVIKKKTSDSLPFGIYDVKRVLAKISNNNHCSFPKSQKIWHYSFNTLRYSTNIGYYID